MQGKHMLSILKSPRRYISLSKETAATSFVPNKAKPQQKRQCSQILGGTWCWIKHLDLKPKGINGGTAVREECKPWTLPRVSIQNWFLGNIFLVFFMILCHKMLNCQNYPIYFQRIKWNVWQFKKIIVLHQLRHWK